MGKHTIEDVDSAGEKAVASDGRLFLGQEYAGKRVEYAVKVIEEESDDA